MLWQKQLLDAIVKEGRAEKKMYNLIQTNNWPSAIQPTRNLVYTQQKLLVWSKLTKDKPETPTATSTGDKPETPTTTSTNEKPETPTTTSTNEKPETPSKKSAPKKSAPKKSAPKKSGISDEEKNQRRAELDKEAKNILTQARAATDNKNSGKGRKDADVMAKAIARRNRKRRARGEEDVQLNPDQQLALSHTAYKKLGLHLAEALGLVEAYKR